MCRKLKQDHFGSQVLELQDCVSRLQDQLSQAQEPGPSAREGEDQDSAARSPWKQVRGHNSVTVAN